jgi:ATP-dependent helicase/nuclease subunit A
MSSREEALRLDTESRYRAQVIFDTPLVLEAGAGTGKTSALVARVVCWCLGEGWERGEEREREVVRRRPQSAESVRDRVAADVLSRVSAITFTEAAAAEMAERAGEAFSGLASGELRPGLMEKALPADLVERSVRARALLGALDHLVVRTIHAWCRRLLARHPLESGMHPGFQVDADGRLQAAVVREVVEEATRDAYASTHDSVLLDLAVQGYGPRELEATLLVLLEKGVTPTALAADPFAPERIRMALAELEAALIRAEESGVFLMVAATRSKQTQETLEALRSTRTALAETLAGADEDSAQFAALESLTEVMRELWNDKTRARLKEWSKQKFNKGETQALQDTETAVAKSIAVCVPWVVTLAAIEPRNFDRVRRALLLLMQRLDEELRVRGIATYASLLSGASELLQNEPLLCARIRRDLDQLLVDEFQDTDALQCELVRSLALEGPESERPGLFLVGDPKQSIYGWRSADLGAYDGFVQEVKKAGGEVRGLSVNFRSVPAILDEVERVIEPLMKGVPGLQPGFQGLDVCDALMAESGFVQSDASPVEHWLSWQWDAQELKPRDNLLAPECVALEAQALARDLRRRHEDQGVAYRSMAILMRSTGDVQEYLAALRAEGVPYAIERDRSYYRKREVIDACALVRCVLDPLDLLALLTLLRSPAAGVPDAAWIPLWSRGFPDQVARLSANIPRNEETLHVLQGLLSEVSLQVSAQEAEVPGLETISGWERSAFAMLENIAALRESFVHDAADVFVQRMRSLSMLEITEAARYQGVFRVANLARFFRELRVDLLQKGDVQAVLRRLRMDESRRPDAEEERPQRLLEDVVAVMTIHKAKGLDFEHVYLPQLHKKSKGNRTPVTSVVPWRGRLEMSLLGLSSLGLAAAQADQAQVEAAELVRTLYVAMTRAKRRLVLMGSWNSEPEPLPSHRARSHVDLLASRRTLPAGLADQMAALSSQDKSHFLDETDTRWVYPALVPVRKGVSPAASGSAASVPDLALVKRDAKELEELRQRAAERMERRWGGVASAAAPSEHREVTAATHFDGDAGPEASVFFRDDSSSNPQIAQISRFAGVAVHRVLEEFTLDAEPEVELARQIARLPEIVDARAGEAIREAAVVRATEILGHFGEGPLFERFAAISTSVVARELDVWAPGQQDEQTHPVGFTAGTIDLLYRDPDHGGWIVADYKTDRLESEEAIEMRARAYRGQGAVYVGAVKAALDLPETPRFELWFLSSGRIVQAP